MRMLLAVDPGFCHSGCARMRYQDGEWAVDELLVINTEPPRNKLKLLRGDADFSRLLETCRHLRTMSKGCLCLLAELPPGGAKSASALRAMSLATGALAGVVGCLGLPYELVQPGDVKKAACGKRSASKEEVMEWAWTKYPEAAKPWRSGRSASGFNGEFEHAADALAVFEASRHGVLVRQIELSGR